MLYREVRLSLTLAVFSTATIVLSFAAQWFIMTRLGAGTVTDALFAGMTIPVFAFEIIQFPLGSVLVPLLARQEREAAGRETWTLLHAVVLPFAGVALALGLTAPWWVAWVVPGFDAEQHRLTAQLARIQLPGAVLALGAAVLAAYCQSCRRFIWSEGASCLAMLATLGFIAWALPRYGVAAAAWGLTLRPALECLCLLPALGRYRKPEWRSALLGETWRALRPLLAGTCYYRTEPLMDRFLMSLAPPGALSLLTLARQMIDAIGRVLMRAVANPMAPRMARWAEAGAWEAFHRCRVRRIGAMIGLVLPMAVGLGWVGRPLLDMVFGGRALAPADLHTLWGLMLALTGVLAGNAVSQVLTVGFYAVGDTRQPTRIGVWAYTLGAGLKCAGFFAAGAMGLAAGLSLYYLVNAGWLWVAARRHAATVLPARSRGEHTHDFRR